VHRDEKHDQGLTNEEGGESGRQFEQVPRISIEEISRTGFGMEAKYWKTRLRTNSGVTAATVDPW
jgi:hypothetical protein